MSELTIKVSNHDDMVGRKEEIEVLQQLHEFFVNRNLYLSNFFRGDLIDWAISCINNDVACDIWAERSYYIAQSTERGATIHKLRVELETLHDEIKTRDENADEYNTARDERIKGMEGTIETLEHINDSLRGDLQMAREKLGTLSEQLHASHEVQIKQNMRISTHQLEIIELKAKLWDTFAEGMPE